MVEARTGNITVEQLKNCAEIIKENAEKIVGEDLRYCERITVEIVLTVDTPEIRIDHNRYLPYYLSGGGAR